jgi:hypothetical protein
MVFIPPSIAVQQANAKIIYDFFMPLIGSNGAVAAVVNAAAESAMDPAAIGDHDTAFGLWQLHPNRAGPIAKAIGIDLTILPPVADQCRAIWQELQTSEKHALAMIKAAPDAQFATEAWCQYYERPGAPGQVQKRGAATDGWIAKLGLK